MMIDIALKFLIYLTGNEEARREVPQARRILFLDLIDYVSSLFRDNRYFVWTKRKTEPQNIYFFLWG